MPGLQPRRIAARPSMNRRSAEAVEELLGAGEVGLALELCPHVAGPLEEQRGLGGVAGGGGGGGGADALR